MSKEIEKAEESEVTSREEFMAALVEMRPDLVLPESWSEDTKAEVAEMVRPQASRRHLYGVIPLKCRGEKCAYAEVCPLQAKNIAPVGNPCPIETMLIQQLMESYMDELGVSPTSMIEVGMVRDLVNQEIQQNRATWLLSMEHFIQENVVGVSPDGEVIKQKQLNLAVELEDKLHRRKRDIRNQLLATREARAKVGQGNLDSAQAISNLIDEVRKHENERDRMLLAKLGKSDDYIDADIVDEDG